MKIALIGVGQQGTSQALAYAKLDRVKEVVCYDANPAVYDEIRAKAAKDGVDISKLVFADSIEAAVQDADVIGLNIPASAFKEVAAEVALHAPSGAALYDNGSGKVQAIKDITEALGDNVDGLYYFPMHFFVGRAGTGPEFADAEMYQGQTAALMDVVNPANSTQLGMLRRIQMEELLRDVGVSNIRKDLSPGDHDESLGLYSHHNTFAVTALMLAFPDVEINGQPVKIGRFLSSTRVAAHGADGSTFWGPIANDNSDAIVAAANRFSAQLDIIKDALRGDSIDALQSIFSNANRYVSDIDQDRKFEGLRGDCHDLQALGLTASETRQYAASHIVAPMVFAAASALTAYEYEGEGGQPFSSIGNPSFHDSIRPARSDFNAAVTLIWNNKETALLSVEALQAKHGEIIEAIEGHDADKVKDFLEQSHAIRTQLPDAPKAARPDFIVG